MNTKITGHEYSLGKIFCNDFTFYIPAYQRPYSWTDEESLTLVDDLINFYKSETNENYFLGSIVLIKQEDNDYSEIIDGQQRITTLTILFSAIASLLDDPTLKLEVIELINSKENLLRGIQAEPRLHLRERDQNFFNKTIQKVDLNQIDNIVIESLSNEAQQNIIKNFREIRLKLRQEFPKEEQLFNFLKFLLDNCFLVIVSTPTQQSAFRIFSVLNSRGMDLMPIDIIKSNIIGKIEPGQQQNYTDLWEDLETLTGRSGFNDLFTHIRMIFAKEKAKKNLLEEFNEYVIPKYMSKDLIEEVLEPYAEIYTTLTQSNYKSTQNTDEINNYLRWLNRIDNSDWIPVALKFFKLHQNDSDCILDFIKKLECLASYLHITRKDINKRIKRYGLILSEIENNEFDHLSNFLESLELSNDEKEEFLSVLNSDIYHLTPVRRNYVILRLNSLVSDNSLEYRLGKDILTIEHVLPQTIKDNSYWDRNWPNQSDREYWLNKIANLVPLTRRKNSRAQNYDFDIKKEKYFKGKGGTTSYPLTVQVLNEEEWIPEILEKRQKELIDYFIQEWHLELTEEKTEEKNFYINRANSNAKGLVIENKKIKVLKGSKISDNVLDSFKTQYQNAFNKRNELENSNIINKKVFQEDYIFDNPSQAAAIILGRNANGYTEWKDIHGKSLENFIESND